MNFEPNCVCENADNLCFEINDDHYRMVYHLHYEKDQLCGYYTQFGKKTPVVYQKQSDIPEDGDYKYIPTEIYVPEEEKPRITGLMRVFYYR